METSLNATSIIDSPNPLKYRVGQVHSISVIWIKNALVQSPNRPSGRKAQSPRNRMIAVSWTGKVTRFQDYCALLSDMVTLL